MSKAAEAVPAVQSQYLRTDSGPRRSSTEFALSPRWYGQGHTRSLGLGSRTPAASWVRAVHAKVGHWPWTGRCPISAPHERADGPVGETARRSIIGHLFDAANLLTLAGLLSSTLAITFAVRGNFGAAAIGLVLAFFFDGIDGPVAKRLSGRTADDRAFGANLDSLVDMAGAGVALAVVLLAYGGFGAAYMPGAFALVGAAALRLSYFNIHGLEKGGSCYVGLPTDHAILAFAAVMLLDGPLGRGPFQVLLYCSAMVLAALKRSATAREE
jgi:phosphatidylserine synthase